MSKIQKTSLSDSVKVITEEMGEAESSSIGFWVSIGSRNEDPAEAGISHFIEHLLFKGTRKRSALDIAREIESVGGMLNAFTAREYTCYYAKVLNKDLGLAIDLLSDIFMNSRFDARDIEKERLVIMQEINMVEDTPDDLVHDLFNQRLWKGHSVGRPIFGSLDTVKNLKRADILDYYKTHYSAGSLLITAAGGFRHGKVVKTAAKSLAGRKVNKGAPKKALGSARRTAGKLQKQPVHLSAASASVAAPAESPGVKLFYRDLEQVHICLGVPTVSLTDPERYKVFLINTILGSGMSSRLFQEIREKRGLAYSVYSYLALLKDAGALVVYSGISTNETAKVLRIIMREFAALAKGVQRNDLKAAKEQIKGGILLGLETSDNRMMKLAKDELCFGRTVPAKELISAIESVTLGELRRAIDRFFVAERITMVALGKVRTHDLPPALRKL